ncbi:bifunctional ADP-dependent NAD(P)H-hydrate dehydratase/NAD(P)H-hydrate epimerase [Spirosoma spitsbergense]|uniref:bifunctional ADP-dependent NAD(P)H-hydrate dehydratase/NAD(P)H-hydrate epimerase n=1 Tax=Spirosoma spitsbergense TaxID=431554 RepID=UPI00037BF8B8|nr:bifunctional ADP-dependent NAD(P)H-hydrate dehydratase/NAD(P)H-hydrate epimerase [Spirosoma spitsbergense]
MKILNVDQIRALDQATIEKEPIAPINLMERAALTFVDWLAEHFPVTTPIKVFCGLGNNGGDGLAIARLLLEREYAIEVCVVRYAPRESDDFMHNHRRLKLITETIRYIESGQDIPALRHNEVVIDAILGSGLSRPADGIVQQVIEQINRSPATVISVDIASGLYTDKPNAPNDVIIEPDYTVTFQLPKLAFMLPDNSRYVGDWQFVDIRLHKRFIDKAPTPYYFTQAQDARLLLKKRNRYSNKGTFGHALLLVGSYGKIGAAVLAAKACLRSGVGLLTVQVPQCGYTILQTAVPEAMCLPDSHQHVLTGNPETSTGKAESPDLASYATVGIGPGIGKAPETLEMLKTLLNGLKKPMVIDADALNLLAENRELLKKLPPDSILTPHPKEFERLTNKWDNDYQKLDMLRQFAQTYKIVVVLKGAHTAVATPGGDIHFNSTGNPGLSTGGTGDVLTGILTALLAQGYDPIEAAVLGVYAHGLAGDRVAEQRGQTGMIASDVIEALRWD